MSDALERLPTDCQDALELLWKRVIERTGRGIRRDDLRATARTVSGGAHASALQPEQLLIAVKDSWTRHTLTAGNRDVSDVGWVLTEFIAICITEFFDGGPGAAAENRPDRRAGDRRHAHRRQTDERTGSEVAL